jgi:hypothetical protein
MTLADIPPEGGVFSMQCMDPCLTKERRKLSVPAAYRNPLTWPLVAFGTLLWWHQQIPVKWEELLSIFTEAIIIQVLNNSGAPK